MMTSKKAPGFYAGMLACVLAIAAAVCYGVVFPGIEYKEQVFDIRICVILAAFSPPFCCWRGSGPPALPPPSCAWAAAWP